VIDKKTGERTCREPASGAREQFLRFRKLQQEQQRRTRDLLLQQRQRAKAQEILDTQERNRQLQFNRRHTLNQREQGRNQDRTVKVQESLARQDPEAQMLREWVLENTLSRRRNLLEQKLKLPRADLLDGQKAFSRGRLKDQSGP